MSLYLQRFVLLLAFMLLPASLNAAELAPGQSLYAGQSISSSNQKYFAVMQADGNFVIYRNDGLPIWSTNTTGLGGVRMTMQADGNLVLYDANNNARWQSGTQGQDYHFYVDGVGFGRIQTAIPVWQSATGDGNSPPGVSPVFFTAGFSFAKGASYLQSNGMYNLTFQSDGNMVLLRNSTPIWSSGTTGLGATIANIDTVLNLWDPPRGMIWQNQITPYTYGFKASQIDRHGTYMVLTPDGNLGMYAPVDIWRTPKGDSSLGGGIEGPSCFGPPRICDAFMIPIIKIHW